MIFTCPCPACEGTGKASDFLCCGDSEDEESCCGDFVYTEQSCHPCTGSGTMDDQTFLNYAILSQDMALLAQHESMVILHSMPALDVFRKTAPTRL